MEGAQFDGRFPLIISTKLLRQRRQLPIESWSLHPVYQHPHVQKLPSIKNLQLQLKRKREKMGRINLILEMYQFFYELLGFWNFPTWFSKILWKSNFFKFILPQFQQWRTAWWQWPSGSPSSLSTQGRRSLYWISIHSDSCRLKYEI